MGGRSQCHGDHYFPSSHSVFHPVGANFAHDGIYTLGIQGETCTCTYTPVRSCSYVLHVLLLGCSVQTAMYVHVYVLCGPLLYYVSDLQQVSCYYSIVDGFSTASRDDRYCTICIVNI